MSVMKGIFEAIGRKLGFKADKSGHYKGLIWELHKRTGFSADRLSKASKSASTIAPDLIGKVGQIYEDTGTGTARDYIDILAKSGRKAKK